VSGGWPLAAGLARAHRIMPRVAEYAYTRMFINTRELGNFPDDLCPLGASRIEIAGVPRVAVAYLWGRSEPTVLAMHGWGAESTSMSHVVQAALASGATAVCFDAPGHGVSPGSRATITEYAEAALGILHRFPTIHTIVAHSLGSIPAVSAVARSSVHNVRNILLLAPACALSDVLERWVAQRDLPGGLTGHICRGLERRDRIPVSHWDIATLGLPASVGVRILHDPTDGRVPVSDSYQIAAAIPANVHEVPPGTGHDGILASGEMRAALTECLQAAASTPGAVRG
jgi:Serine aminopeptidase, S33